MRVLLHGTTYRRGVFLLLGGVLVLPYALLVTAFAQAWTAPEAPRGALVVLAVVAAAIGAVPPFLHGTRAVEIAAARWLLAVELPDPVPGAEGVETRLRSALWFAVHLVVGGLVGLGLLIALPLALVAALQPFGGVGEAMRGQRIGPFDEHDTGWLTVLGLVILVALLYAVAGLGALAATMAPVLLGPSQTARIAALEADAVRLAERNRLARELHDSVGHALTVTTLQAAAARQLLASDPAFVDRALQAVEEVGRSAMADLDAVLAVLRDDQPPARTPGRSLPDLRRLVEETGAAVDLRVDGSLGELPAAVSREGYRIVQESLTNALRHAGKVPVAVRLTVGAAALDVAVENPLSGPPGAPGRGLAGMKERVTLLGGRFAAGPQDGRWSVTARLPFGARR